MPGIPSFVDNAGWTAVYVFLFFVVFTRAQGTYWLGRAAVAGLLHTKWSDRFTGEGMGRAHAFLERWGPIGVPLSFLTIGFQTMVLATAGFTRMRATLFTAVMIPGCLAWAAIYTALGAAAVTLIAKFSWYAAIGLIAIAAAVAVIVRRRSAATAARIPR